MRSIRVFLVASILAALTLFNFVAALQGYKSSLLEAEKLFDGQLLHTAKLIAKLPLNEKNNGISHLNDFEYQIWHQNKLLSSSNDAKETIITEFYPG